jgi:hypothetical protein
MAVGKVPGGLESLDGWTPGGLVAALGIGTQGIRDLGLANSESKFILYETYKSGPTCHILAGSPSGSGYGATENIPTPTVPDGHNK